MSKRLKKKIILILVLIRKSKKNWEGGDISWEGGGNLSKNSYKPS